MPPVPVAIETGSKRVVASAIDWPGWCRSARDEDGAIETLLAYAPRYARVVAHLGTIALPDGRADLVVVERLAGGSATDFGVPSVPPTADSAPVTPELRALVEQQRKS